MTENAQTPEQSVENTDQPTVTLVDLQNALRIIDAAAERGAFRGPELTSVGGVRDKIASFLEAVLPPAQDETPAVEESKVEEPKKAPARKGRK